MSQVNTTEAEQLEPSYSVHNLSNNDLENTDLINNKRTMEAVPKMNLCTLPFAEFFTPRLREPGKILNMTKSKDKETNSSATYGMKTSPRVSP